MRRLALLLLCFFPAAAQISVPHLPSGSVALKNGWRTHSGDNLAWAQPGFNDSLWPATMLGPDTPLVAAWSWYRLTLPMPSQTAEPLGLLVNAPGGTCEVYIDGRRASAETIGSWLHMTAASAQIVPLPQDFGVVHIALRVDYPKPFAGSYGSFLNVRVGGLSGIQAAAASTVDDRVLNFLPAGFAYLAILLAGIGAFGLSLAQRTRREYFWLGLYLVIDAGLGLPWRAVESSLIPYWWNGLVADPLTSLQIISLIEFTFAFIGRPVGRVWRLLEVSVLAILPTSFLTAAGLFPSAIYWGLQGLAQLGTALALPILLLVQFRRGNREAGWLILPILLAFTMVGVVGIGTVATIFDWPLPFLPSIHFARTSIDFTDLGDFVFLLAIGVVMYFRFNSVRREQARVASELEAAQRVQALLLRSQPVGSATLRIENVYRPAQEVGGDFFHVAAVGERTRLVIGDVSGRGLGAAMLVSAIIGALDTLHDPAPARVLRSLNDLLLGRQQGGFATCLCAVVAPTGEIRMANAGHLAPYCNGFEVAVESGLPLGLAAGIDYAETSLHLAPGDTLTFLTDGVVEARNAAGELYGIDRTAAISARSAEEIVSAASTFGQEDDITVLTVAFAGAEVAHA
jgi:phosphoserine phosphatase RsbU/P